jgi:glycosyltransferase involved in cell wall biosynthesis
MGTWALSQAVALQSAGNVVQIISPVPAIPRIVGKLFRRGSSAACPARHRWDGIDIDARYVRWPMYPVGPLARLMRANPGIFLKVAWALSRRRFMRIAEAFAPDVVFAHHGQLGGYIASRMARKLGIPYFLSEHDFDDIEWCATSERQRRYYLQILKRVSGWIAVSNRMGASMRRIFPDVPELTVHNGAELIPENLKSVPRPAALAGKLVVLCVSFFYKRKNVPLLIKCFDRIAARHPDAVLVIGGDGNDMPAVAAALAAAHHRSQVTLLGRLTHREVLQYMIWCDVFALIGIDEPFGVVFAEAMMAGKPIIYSSDAGIGDLAKNEVHGLSVRPGDEESPVAALDRLLADGVLRGELAASATRLAQTELTWEGNARRLARIFQAAL